MTVTARGRRGGHISSLIAIRRGPAVSDAFGTDAFFYCSLRDVHLICPRVIITFTCITK